MTSAFSTHYDRIPQRHRDDPGAIADARAGLMSEPCGLSRTDAASPALADPTLLRGTRIERFSNETDRIFIDFGIAFPEEQEEPDPEATAERFAGPARLVAEGRPVLRCSGTHPAEANADDAIVWNELRFDSGTARPELILVCASGRHWSIAADSIRFASVMLPG